MEWVPVFNTFADKGNNLLVTKIYNRASGVEIIQHDFETSTVLIQQATYTEPTITVTSAANLALNEFTIDVARTTSRKLALKASIVDAGVRPVTPKRSSSSNIWIWITVIIALAAIAGVTAWYCLIRSRLRSESEISTSSLAKNNI